MNRTIAFTLTLAASSLVVFNARAYDEDIHFHLTYYLARCAGFQESSSLGVSLAAQYTDEHGDSYPTLGPTPLDAEQRRLYHFPKWDSTHSPDVQRNSIQGRYEMSKILEEAKSVAHSGQELWDLLIRLGMATHVLQDSYSHEGYGYGLGHAVDGHDPDRPYLRTGAGWFEKEGWDNPKKGLEMSRLVYTRLRQFLLNLHGTSTAVCSWDDMKPRLTEWFNYMDSGWSSTYLDSDDYEKEIDQRCDHWQSQINEKTDFGDKDYDRSVFESQYKGHFERGISRHCLPHRKFHYDPNYIVAASPIAPRPTLPALPSDTQKIGGWLGALPQSASTLQIVDTMSAGDLDTKDELRAIQRTNTAKIGFNARLALAHRLTRMGRDKDAEKQFERCRLSAKTAEQRMAVLEWLPRTERFRPHFERVLQSGTPDEKAKAAHALYATGSSRARGALKEYARATPLEDLAKDPAGYFALLSYDDANSTPAETTFLVETLKRAVAKNHAEIIKPILIALPAHAEQGGEALIGALRGALRSSEDQLRWQAGYAVERITGETLDLTRVDSEGFVEGAERALSKARR